MRETHFKLLNVSYSNSKCSFPRRDCGAKTVKRQGYSRNTTRSAGPVRRFFTAKTQPASQCRRLSNRVGSIEVESGGVRLLMDRIESGRVGSGRVGSGRVGSGRVGSGRVGSGRVGSGRVGLGWVESGQVKSGRVW